MDAIPKTFGAALGIYSRKDDTREQPSLVDRIGPLATGILFVFAMQYIAQRAGTYPVHFYKAVAGGALAFACLEVSVNAVVGSMDRSPGPAYRLRPYKTWDRNGPTMPRPFKFIGEPGFWRGVELAGALFALQLGKTWFQKLAPLAAVSVPVSLSIYYEVFFGGNQ